MGLKLRLSAASIAAATAISYPALGAAGDTLETDEKDTERLVSTVMDGLTIVACVFGERAELLMLRANRGGGVEPIGHLAFHQISFDSGVMELRYMGEVYRIAGNESSYRLGSDVQAGVCGNATDDVGYLLWALRDRGLIELAPDSN